MEKINLMKGVHMDVKVKLSHRELAVLGTSLDFTIKTLTREYGVDRHHLREEIALKQRLQLVKVNLPKENNTWTL